MDNNYTPIDVDKIEYKDNGVNTVLLVIVTLTALVLAVMLFVLIQKKMNSTSDILPTPMPTQTITQPTQKPTPTEELFPVATATPTINLTVTPEASPTSNITQK